MPCASEFKQLRYALEHFRPLLGSAAGRFVRQVKAMQEILGRIQDIAVFTDYMMRLDDLPTDQAEVIEAYIATRHVELVSPARALRRGVDALQQSRDPTTILRLAACLALTYCRSLYTPDN